MLDAVVLALAVAGQVEEALSEESQQRTGVAALQAQLVTLQEEVSKAAEKLSITQQRVEKNLQRVNELKAEAVRVGGRILDALGERGPAGHCAHTPDAWWPSCACPARCRRRWSACASRPSRTPRRPAPTRCAAPQQRRRRQRGRRRPWWWSSRRRWRRPRRGGRRRACRRRPARGRRCSSARWTGACTAASRWRSSSSSSGTRWPSPTCV